MESPAQDRGKFREAAVDLIAGSLGGVANVYVGQSLDTVKVKMQTFPHLYTNMFDCFRATFREGGLRALYAGTVPSLAANIAENSVLFAAYGVCQKAVAWAVDAPVHKPCAAVRSPRSNHVRCISETLDHHLVPIMSRTQKTTSLHFHASSSHL